MEDSTLTIALCGAMMALIEVIKKLIGGKGGGISDYKQQVLEDKLDQLQESTDTLKTAFYQFREEARIRWAKEDSDDG
jgi:hypothetical protein